MIHKCSTHVYQISALTLIQWHVHQCWIHKFHHFPVHPGLLRSAKHRKTHEFGIVWVSLLFGHSWPMFTLRLLTLTLRTKFRSTSPAPVPHPNGKGQHGLQCQPHCDRLVTFRGSDTEEDPIWESGQKFDMDHYLISWYIFQNYPNWCFQIFAASYHRELHRIS